MLFFTLLCLLTAAPCAACFGEPSTKLAIKQKNLYILAQFSHEANNIEAAMQHLDALYARFTQSNKSFDDFIYLLSKQKHGGEKLADLFTSFHNTQEELSTRALTLMQGKRYEECLQTLQVLRNRAKTNDDIPLTKFIDHLKALDPQLATFYLNALGRANRAARLTATFLENEWALHIEVYTEEILDLFRTYTSQQSITYTTLLPMDIVKPHLRLPLLLFLLRLPCHQKKQGVCFFMDWFTRKNHQGEITRQSIAGAYKALERGANQKVFLKHITEFLSKKADAQNLAYVGAALNAGASILPKKDIPKKKPKKEPVKACN